jgi:hypothetical protein
LNAIQALSQLSYGPAGDRTSDLSDQEPDRADRPRFLLTTEH